MNISAFPVMLNKAESPPEPMPYVKEWPSRTEFCADTVVTARVPSEVA